MRVEWTDRALADLRDVRESRAELSPDSADRLSAAILKRTRQLGAFPRSGRVIPEFQVESLRELLEDEFRVLYEIYPDRVEVFGVVSARRQLLPDNPPHTE